MAQIQMLMLVEVSVAAELVLHGTPVELVRHGTPLALEVSVAEKLVLHATSLEVSVAVEAVDVHETPLPFSSFSYSYQMLTQSCCLSLLFVSFFCPKQYHK